MARIVKRWKKTDTPPSIAVGDRSESLSNWWSRGVRMPILLLTE
jgi:hypothetical protein